MEVRITPACAGRSEEFRRSDAKYRDHPRVCGEKCRKKFFIRRRRGSPPRVRGEAGPSRPPRPADRITPACAGRSRRSRRWTPTPQDHPRVCGEKRCLGNAVVPQQGSPPRVRGEGLMGSARMLILGITPACAGRRTTNTYRERGKQDHPRVCGEKHVRRAAMAYITGSPPRVRGEAGDCRIQRRAVGITPACAGRRCTATKA